MRSASGVFFLSLTAHTCTNLQKKTKKTALLRQHSWITGSLQLHIQILFLCAQRRQLTGTEGNTDNDGDVGLISFSEILYWFIWKTFEKLNFVTNGISIFCCLSLIVESGSCCWTLESLFLTIIWNCLTLPYNKPPELSQAVVNNYKVSY